MRIAQTVGCKVVGITLSHEQKALAERRVAKAGLSDLIQYAQPLPRTQRPDRSTASSASVLADPARAHHHRTLGTLRSF